MISRLGSFQRRLNLLLLFLLVFVSACGSPPPRQPMAIEQAKKADQAAHRALHDGDLMRAREFFKQSMLMQQSLDDQAASAMAAINLSYVSHKLGDDGVALELLDNILRESSTLIPTDLRTAAAFRKGVIMADSGKLAEAESALQLASLSCNKQCAFTSGMNNLRARLALDKGDFETALSMAINVINAGAEKEEVANAQRIAATAESTLNRNEAALANYHAALELDKELALSARIAEDLIGIAKVLEKLGRKSEAADFARRADMVKAASYMLPVRIDKKSIH
jgi:tetratricopeptide (TPR) repeat protein